MYFQFSYVQLLPYYWFTFLQPVHTFASPEAQARSRLSRLRESFTELRNIGSSVDPMDPAQELDKILKFQRRFKEALGGVGQWVDSVGAEMPPVTSGGGKTDYKKALAEFKVRLVDAF